MQLRTICLVTKVDLYLSLPKNKADSKRERKMKRLTKKGKIIIAVTAVVVLIAVAALFAFLNMRQSPDESVDVNLTKAKAVSNAVWVSEGTDFEGLKSIADAERLSSLGQSAQTVSDHGFDTVYLRAKHLYKSKYRVKYKDGIKLSKLQKKVSLASSRLDIIKTECAVFSSRSLNVILAVDIMTYDSVISSLASQGISGFIVTGCGDCSAEIVNKRLKAIKTISENINPAAVVYADFESVDNLDKVKLDSQHMTCLSAELNSDDALNDTYLEKINSVLLSTDVGLIAGFKCELITDTKSEFSVDTLLNRVMGADKCSKLAARAFSSLSVFSENTDNGTATVEKYIRNGIDIEKALTPLKLDSEIKSPVITEETSYTFKVECSDSFSLYINGSLYGVVGENFCNITLELHRGENEISVTQCGKTVSFTVKCTKSFDGEPVSFITPADPTYYNGDQTVQITVGAFYQAKLKAKLGDKELKLKPLGTSSGDYSVFSASVKLPKAESKIKDMGKVTVEATLDGKTYSYEGGNIFVSAKSTADVTQNSSSQLASPSASYQGQITVSGKNLTPYTDNGVSGTGNYIIVSAPTAETYPSDTSKPYYDPNCCLWAQGTIDRVIGETSRTNGDGDTFAMYELASGRRIVKTDATYIPQGHIMPENTVGVLASDTASGLDVTLSTMWRVPYSINRYNQSYYTGYEKKKYNVVSHTVSVIDVVLYNTPTHSGEVNCSGSGIVEKAEWVSDAASGTSILRFYLKKQGGFYGMTVKYDDSGNMHINFKQPKSTLSGKVIIIDPGHGGVQPGATGKNGTVLESHQTLKISRYLAEYLSRAGASVYMTRTDDVDISLEARRRMTELIEPELFISIHLNASEDKNRSGTSTFYYKAFSQPLAQCIHNRLMEVYRTSCYDDNRQMYAAIDGGANYYPFYVTRTDICPSVLVEVGFISNDLECAFLVDDAYQQAFAQAIYRGVVDYVSINNQP